MAYVSASARTVFYGALLLPVLALGVEGDLDPEFGVAGMVPFGGGTRTHGSPAVALQSDGRIIVCDAVQGTTTGYDLFIARFDSDGAPDTSFGSNGSTTLSLDQAYVDDYCAAMAIQSDGKIVLVGARDHQGFPGDYPYFAVTRIDADGALDQTFAGGAGFMEFAFGPTGLGGASAVTLDADERIIVAGGAQPNYLDEDFAVARLLPDGSFDPTFNVTGQLTIPFFPGSHSYDYATHVSIDSQGRIVLAGNASNQCALVRLQSDGSFDSTFGIGGMLASNQVGGADGFLIDHEGRLVVAGAIATTGGTDPNGDMSVARFLDDGSLDATFGVSGISTVGFDLASDGAGRDGALDVVEQSDGKLVALGYAEYGDQGYSYAAATRVDENGQLDTSFGVGGKNVFSFGPSPPNWQWFTGAILSGGHIIAVVGVENGDTQASLDDVLVRLQNENIFASGFD